MSDALECKYLAKIEDAEDLHREVIAKWRWVRIGVPVNVVVVIASAFFGPFGTTVGIDTGGVAFAGVVIGLFMMTLCVLWFSFTVPRSDGSYSWERRMLHPHDTAKKVKEAKRGHLEFIMQQQEKRKS
jgi:hypothetical protein